MTIPPIKDFPQDDRIWRIDYLGQISRNSNIYTEPLVDIHMSPVTNLSLYLKKPYSINAINPKEQITLPIGVGHLEVLRTGTGWQNGKIQYDVSTHKVKPISLPINITSETTKIIKANTSIKDLVTGKKTGLVSKKFIHLNTALETYLVSVDTKDEPYKLLIPMIELIRFYYTVSSKMSRMIFNGSINEPNNIINKDSFNMYTLNTKKYLELKLRKDLRDEDGWTIGRILTSEIANKNAFNIHNSLRKASINKEPLCPATSFPFIGDTTLKFQCQRIESFNGQWHLLVTRLISCSHPLGFDYLSVDRDNNNAQTTDGTPYSNRETIDIPRNSNNRKEGEESIVHDKEPNINLEKVVLSLPENRFTSITTKIIKPEKDECHYRSGTKQPLNPIISKNLSSGDGYNNNSTTSEFSAEVTNHHRMPLPATFENLIISLDELSNNNRLSYEPIEIESHNNFTFIELFPGASIFPTRDNGKLIKWSFINIKDRLPRQALIVKIRLNNSYVYLLEVEKHPNKNDSFSCYYFCKVDGSIINNVEIFKLLLDFTRFKRGKFPLKYVFKNYRHITAIHRSKNFEQYTNNMFEKITLLRDTG